MDRIYIDMDDVLCDYMGAHRRESAINLGNPYPQSRKGFYLELQPIDGAIDALAFIEKDDRFDHYILTAPSIYNPHSYTEKRLWTEKHLGFEWCNRLILSPNKSLLRGDILIDDRISGHEQDKFEGKIIQFGSNEYPNWETIMHSLEK